MKPIKPAEIRYIKLGRGGKWAKQSLADGDIHFGFSGVPHELCQAGDWSAVTECLIQAGKKPSKATDNTREIRDFYTLGSGCLWVTFAAAHMWWAFADPEVIPLDDGSATGARMRKTLDGWHKENTKGEALLINDLSTLLTKTASYRGTLCSIEPEEYLLRRINAVEEPVIGEARKARASMVSVAAEMIAGLHWSDFEVLVDLIFARSGWQRVSRVGGSQVDVDLIMEQPTTGERAFVQVKSKANQRVFDDYLRRFQSSEVYDRFFFVCHSPTGKFSAELGPNQHLWIGDSLAEAATRVGLFDWLIEQTA